MIRVLKDMSTYQKKLVTDGFFDVTKGVVGWAHFHNRVGVLCFDRRTDGASSLSVVDTPVEEGRFSGGGVGPSELCTLVGRVL